MVSHFLPTLLFSIFHSLLLLLPVRGSTQGDYLKLRLLHQTPRPSPQQALALDYRRLAALSAAAPPPAFLSSPVVSGASTGSGQYFVDFRIGTPPQKLLLVADTGSDLVWVRCSACRNCSRHPPETSFLSRHSSSFSPFHCYDHPCLLVPHPRPNPVCNLTRAHSPCRFQYSYSDTSTSSGFFSREIATLNASSGNEIRIRGLSFGCGFNVSGPSVTGPRFGGAHGVMGLGRGPISFPSQAGKKFGNMFSYCLLDYSLSPPPTSYLLIGDSHVITGEKRRRHLRFTPLLSNPLSPTFYYVSVVGAAVDGVSLLIDPAVWDLDNSTGGGGTVIDSGTSLTFLPEPAYREILAAMERRVRLPRVSIGGGGGQGFDLCVNVTGLGGPQLPRLGLRLAGGAVLAPPPRNYFVDAAEGVRCLALQPVSSDSGGFGVIGNMMQQGFLFTFDRDKSRLGFSRVGCAV